ncbi:MAG: single-stranded DNA-binding protein [Caldithrix sp.]|nr:single-stranded DNA-binding protein [Caldithrix sp.]
MMSRGTVNKAIIIGRLGADPEMRYAPSGTAVANFRVATNSRTKDQEGNWTDNTEWHSVVAFGKTAEIAGEYLKKGKLVYLEGRLQTRNWEDQNGVKHYRTEIITENLQFLGSKDQGDGQQASSSQQEQKASGEQSSAEQENPENEDDLPF